MIQSTAHAPEAAGAPADRALEIAAGALAERLLRDGFLIMPGAASPAAMAALSSELAPHFDAACFGEGLFYGETTKRFGRLLARSKAAADFVLNRLVLRVAELALGARDGLQLNLTQGIEIHPGAPVQVPHRDHEMWPVEKTGAQLMVNVMWPLDDFTAENGATRIWPRSHLHKEVGLAEDAAIAAAAPRGSAILFLGSTLHGGGANRSAAPRRGMIVSYCQSWLLPDENPWLAYPPEVAAGFPPALARLAGYRQRFAGLNNFEGRCPSLLLRGEGRTFLPFADHLTTDQNARIRAYYERIGSREAA